MNEIEKLYATAGIEKKEFGFCTWDSYCPYTECEDTGCDATCPYWEIEKVGYPPFTAEKQLELIKWLAFRDYITIIAYISGEYHSEHDKYNANENSLEGCLARLINNLWQDLIETEQEEIRDILKG